MDAEEVVAIETYGDANSGAEGQLPDQRPAATQEHGGVYEGPTAACCLTQ